MKSSTGCALIALTITGIVGSAFKSAKAQDAPTERRTKEMPSVAFSCVRPRVVNNNYSLQGPTRAVGTSFDEKWDVKGPNGAGRYSVTSSNNNILKIDARLAFKAASEGIAETSFALKNTGNDPLVFLEDNFNYKVKITSTKRVTTNLQGGSHIWVSSFLTKNSFEGAEDSNSYTETFSAIVTDKGGDKADDSLFPVIENVPDGQQLTVGNHHLTRRFSLRNLMSKFCKSKGLVRNTDDTILWAKGTFQMGSAEVTYISITTVEVTAIPIVNIFIGGLFDETLNHNVLNYYKDAEESFKNDYNRFFYYNWD